MAKFGNIRNQVAGRTGTQDARTAELAIKDIPIGDIEIRDNVRKEYTDLDELKESIRQYGLLQPITVYRAGDVYVVKVGHRRYMAFKLLYSEEPEKYHSIRCIVSNADDIAIIQLVENVQRVDLSQAELYEALNALRNQGLSVKQIADLMGKKEGYVKNQFMAVNEINGNKKLEELVSHAGVTLQDIAETKGIPDEQTRIDLLRARQSGEINRFEMRKKVGELKKSHAGMTSEDISDNSSAGGTMTSETNLGIDPLQDYSNIHEEQQEAEELETEKPSNPTLQFTTDEEAQKIVLSFSEPIETGLFAKFVDSLKQFFLDNSEKYTLSF